MRRCAVSPRTWITLGLATVVVACGTAVAQTPPAAAGRLSVRPREMATGAQNPAAGEHALTGLPGYKVYVAKSCVGAQRCPLVVLMSGGGYGAETLMEMHAQHAEKYGMILLAPDPVTPGRFDVINGYAEGSLEMDPNRSWVVRAMPNAPDLANIDAALKQVLANYAIDPDKIALGGMSDGASYSLFLGLSNLDVFSRIGLMSPGIPFRGVGPQNPSVQFFTSGGLLEGGSGFFSNPLVAAQEMRQAGYPVKQVLGLRPHQNRIEEHDLLWRWLRDSWATADPSARPAATAPPALADSLPLLTTAGVARFQMFWASFMDEPDSVLTTARSDAMGPERLRHLKEITIPVGQERMSVLVTDIVALAAQYPSVAADLKQAGFTAAQAEAYRAALISARATQQAADLAGNVEATSALGKNVQFLDTQTDVVGALETMWATP